MFVPRQRFICDSFAEVVAKLGYLLRLLVV